MQLQSIDVIDPREMYFYFFMFKNYAALVPREIDVARINDLFDQAVIEGDPYQRYLDSTWFPMVEAATAEEATLKIKAKIATLSADRLDDYRFVIREHWGYIEANYRADLPADFNEAVDLERAVEDAVALYRREF